LLGLRFFQTFCFYEFYLTRRAKQGHDVIMAAAMAQAPISRRHPDGDRLTASDLDI
jgi:hypothetical protein